MRVRAAEDGSSSKFPFTESEIYEAIRTSVSSDREAREATRLLLTEVERREGTLFLDDALVVKLAALSPELTERVRDFCEKELQKSVELKRRAFRLKHNLDDDGILPAWFETELAVFMAEQREKLSTLLTP